LIEVEEAMRALFHIVAEPLSPNRSYDVLKGQVAAALKKMDQLEHIRRTTVNALRDSRKETEAKEKYTPLAPEEERGQTRMATIGKMTGLDPNQQDDLSLVGTVGPVT